MITVDMLREVMIELGYHLEVHNLKNEPESWGMGDQVLVYPHEIADKLNERLQK